MAYYQKFVDRYPTVQHLADADEQEVLHLWAGLGYYSRARNLLKAAKQVMTDYKGVFPNQYQELLRLKGVGDYTAAAIASFSAKEAVPVVDGNVFRVLARVFGIDADIAQPTTRAIFQNQAMALLPPKNADTFNQAIMEFGALQCTKAPVCMYCPLQGDCVAFATGQVKTLPVKKKKQAPKEVFFYSMCVQRNGKLLVEQRDDKSIWKNMYQLPSIVTEKAEMPNEQLQDLGFEVQAQMAEIKHQLTHRTIRATFYQADYWGDHPGYKWVSAKDLEKLPFPVLMSKFVKDFESL